jgi:hypothetical protein
LQAFECGLCEYDLRGQVKLALESHEGLSQRAAEDFDIEDCVRCVTIVWTTLILSPRSVKRWAIAKPLNESTIKQWQGFCTLIVDAYFNKRMAW